MTRYRAIGAIAAVGIAIATYWLVASGIVWFLTTFVAGRGFDNGREVTRTLATGLGAAGALLVGAVVFGATLLLVSRGSRDVGTRGAEADG